MKEIYEIKNVEQLKAISDPLRIQILWEIIDGAKTGKMLADSLGLPASKVHYHLKELEKADIITVERTEEKNGIVQKFYRSVAYQLKIDETLLPHADLITDSVRTNILSSLELSKKIVSKAEDELFKKSSNREDTLLQTVVSDVYLTEDQITWLRQKIEHLLNELFSTSDHQDKKVGKRHHLNWLVIPRDDEGDS